MSNSGDSGTLDRPTNRRRFLKGLGTLSIVGLAGCGGDGEETDTPTSTDTPTETMGDTPTEADTATPTEIDTATATETDMATPTDTATPTAAPCTLPGEPAPLLGFDNVSDATLSISPNAETITGSVTNPYLFDVQNIEVTLNPPTGDWEVTGEATKTFDTLAQQSTQDVEWSVSVPSVSGQEFELTADVTYERVCENDTATAEVQKTQAVFVDPYQGQPWQDLAIAPEYYDDLTEDQEAPGELPGEEVTVELDLSDWGDAASFQLRFTDYWTSDGWGPLLYTGSVSADGEELYSFDPPDDDGSLIVDGGGNGDANPEGRFADANGYWVYQFDLEGPLDEPADELIVTLGIANGFDIDGREGLER